MSSTDDDLSSISWTQLSFTGKSDAKTNPSTGEKQIKEHLSTVSRRKRIIIITIIVILILVIITMIATMISLLKPNDDTKTQASTLSTNRNDYRTPVTTTTIYDVGNGGISNDSPCLSYTAVNDPSRSVDAAGIGGTCDNGPLLNTNIGGRWIRFLGNGGTVIPSQSPGLQHCSAYLAGWSNTTLPSTNGTLIEGTGCFETGVGTCGFTTFIKIMNCGTFYVYFLPPVTFCNARYCTV